MESERGAELGSSSSCSSSAVEVRPLARRWLALALFCLVSVANGFQWIQFAIVSDSLAWFYGVSAQAVQWTALMYMVTYVPGILPVSWFLDAKGLMWTVRLAALGNCVAAWLKVVAARPDLVALLFAAQAVAAVAQLFVLGVPARLAAVWFGARQVSTATAIAVIGNQVGNALGFVLPSLLVRAPPSSGADHGSDAAVLDAMQGDMLLVGYIVAGATSVTAVCVFFGFQEEPSVAPSVAQAALRLQGRSCGSLSAFVASLGAVVRCPGFPQLLVAYSVSTGVCFAASIILNELILAVFPDSKDDAGLIGLTMVFAGLLGSVVCGLLLDATAKFKEMTVCVYCLSVVALIAFTGSLLAAQLWAVYVSGAFAGLALAGYVSVGFEFAAELTFPLPEGTSSGLLNAGAQLLGIGLTLACGAFVAAPNGWQWSCALMTAVLVVGAVVTLTIPNSLRRQAAQRGDCVAR